jgi:hypothetical protein
MTASVDATETKVLTALAELTTYFQEGHDFSAFLCQIQKYTLLSLGMVLPDLHDCSGCLLAHRLRSSSLALRPRL